MAATAAYVTRVSAGEYPHVHGGSVSPPLTPLSATLVNTPHHNNDRPSVKLKIPCGKSNIVNSLVVDAAGQSLYSVSSDSKRTTLFSCRNNVKVATIEWDRSSPRLVYRRKKMRCKEWLPLAGPETESRVLTHGDSQFTWMHGSTSGYLLPANRPGLAVARWRIKSRSDDLRLEIFQDALAEPDLLEAIILSVVLLRSGRSLGDIPDMNSFSDPRFFTRHGFMNIF